MPVNAGDHLSAGVLIGFLHRFMCSMTSSASRTTSWTICAAGVMSCTKLHDSPAKSAMDSMSPLKLVIGIIAPYFGTSTVVPARETVPTMVPSPGR